MINLKSLNLDSEKVYIFADYFNIYYLTGIKSSNMYVFIINNEMFTLTDPRYEQQVKDKGIKNYLFTLECLDEIKKRIGDKELYLNQITLELEKYQLLQKLFKNKIIFSNEFYRDVKTKDELKKISNAVKLTYKIWEQFKVLIKPNVSEVELARKLKILILESGADSWSFEPIVASGTNSASPHFSPSEKKLSEGEVVTIDFGVNLEGYISDLTFTVPVGEIDDAKKQVLKVLQESIEIAISTIKPGVLLMDSDEAVRKHMAKFGYDKYFIHSLGHGFGMDVHEFPNYTPHLENRYKENQTITIEPGIYLPDDFGARLEVDIRVTSDGAEIIK